MTKTPHEYYEQHTGNKRVRHETSQPADIVYHEQYIMICKLLKILIIKILFHKLALADVSVKPTVTICFLFQFSQSQEAVPLLLLLYSKIFFAS